MAYIILTDRHTNRSVLFDTVTETPLYHQAFLGVDCEAQAEDFLDWLDCDPRDIDGLRARGYERLDLAVSAWSDRAFDAQDEFVGAAR